MSFDDLPTMAERYPPGWRFRNVYYNLRSEAALERNDTAAGELRPAAEGIKRALEAKGLSVELK